ncbi:MAG: nitroreductase/quinone reductase family protein [Pseudomonadales bacterium]|nr:nitroreductase/quinone reductase family protein [Pseudomonadales bacterium]
MSVATFIDEPLMRISRGWLRLSFIVPVLLLQCRGAKSGQIRNVPLLCVPDGEDVLLVASKGGQVRRPAWCHNLRAHPDVSGRVTGGRRALHASELSGEERVRACRLS